MFYHKNTFSTFNFDQQMKTERATNKKVIKSLLLESHLNGMVIKAYQKLGIEIKTKIKNQNPKTLWKIGRTMYTYPN